MAKKTQKDVITRADGSVIKLGGYKPPQASYNAPKFKAKIKSKNLPPKVDLRKYMTQIENQGSLGSCTANATAGAYEYLVNRNQGIDNYDVSRLFLYYNSREIEDTIEEDGGAYLTDVLQALADKGICSEKSWPYVIEKFTKRPPKACFAEAEKNKIEKYEQVDTDLESWKSVLAEGYPIIFSLHLFDSFMNPRRGRVSVPKRGEKEVGGHAMLCVGYSDPDQVFIVRNSWGESYGAAGYCYIPYEYMMSKHNYGDSWVIYDVNEIDPSEAEDTWSEDDESLFVDMYTEFDEMDDETWAAMCEELGDYDITYRLGVLYGMATVGDDDVSDEEYSTAIEKLGNILEMFGLNYDAEEVMEYCAELCNVEGFVQETVEILGRYLSAGALATIAKDMYEIAAVDGLEPEEEQFIDELIGEWYNEDLAEEYDNTYENRRREYEDSHGCCCDDDDDDDEDFDDDEEDFDEEDDEDFDEDDEDFDEDDEDFDDEDDEEFDDEDDEDFDEDDEEGDFDENEEEYDEEDEDERGY
ncbi:MAG: hypothetical protein II956_12515 [Bacteroidales bacterium]|nr:hypothetical protein [Bacteroidales bacterium]